MACIFCGSPGDIPKGEEDWKGKLKCLYKLWETSGEVEIPGAQGEETGVCPPCNQVLEEVVQLEKQVENLRQLQRDLGNKLRVGLQNRVAPPPPLPQGEVVLMSEELHTDAPEETEDIRLSKVKALHHLQDSPVSPPPEEEKPPLRKISKKPKPPKNLPKSPRAISERLPKVSSVCQLTPSLYLYKYTLLRHSPPEGFFCEEPSCHQLIVPQPPTTFDYYAAFHSLKSHVDTVHLSDKSSYMSLPRPCPLPSCTFSQSTPSPGNGNALRRHLLKSPSHPCPPRPCPACLRPLLSDQSLLTHLWSHNSPQERLSAPAPRKITSRLSRLRQQSHLPWPCPQCSKSFGNNELLRKHLRLRHPPAPSTHSCPHCPQTLSTATSLKEHLRRQHLPAQLQRWRYCPICNQQFYWNDGKSLREHLARHKGDKPWVCEECGQAFVRRDAMKSHQRNVHQTTGRQHQCPHCEMVYKHQRNLKRHLGKMHNQQKNKGEEDKRKGEAFIGPRIAYPCEICDKVFELRCRLTQHVKAMHGEPQQKS